MRITHLICLIVLLYLGVAIAGSKNQSASSEKLSKDCPATQMENEFKMCLPTYFAGKDELCIDGHKPKNLDFYEIKSLQYMEITMHTADTGKETHCVIFNLENPKKPGGKFDVTLSGSRCETLKSKLNKTVVLGVTDDHVCEVQE